MFLFVIHFSGVHGTLVCRFWLSLLSPHNSSLSFSSSESTGLEGTLQYFYLCAVVCKNHQVWMV